ncbi:Adenosylhomocysteinase [Burkholderia cenocepacia]|nr:Adenosylhomocysteinase [Burkholderia cenocepacia]
MRCGRTSRRPIRPARRRESVPPPREDCSPQPGAPTNGRRHSKNSARHTEARRTPPQAEADRVEKTWFLETRATA